MQPVRATQRAGSGVSHSRQHRHSGPEREQGRGLGRAELAACSLTARDRSALSTVGLGLAISPCSQPSIKANQEATHTSTQVSTQGTSSLLLSLIWVGLALSSLSHSLHMWQRAFATRDSGHLVVTTSSASCAQTLANATHCEDSARIWRHTR